MSREVPDRYLNRFGASFRNKCEEKSTLVTEPILKKITGLNEPDGFAAELPRRSDIQDPAVLGNGFDPRCHGALRTARKGIVDKPCAVVVWSLQGPKDVAKSHLAAIAYYPAQRDGVGVLSPLGRQDSAASRLCQIVQGFHQMEVRPTMVYGARA